MSQLRDKRVGSRSGMVGGPQDSDGSSPLRVFVVGAVVIIALVAVVLGAIRVFLFPVWEDNSEGVRQVATAEAQLAVARTQQALTPVPTATSLVTSMVRPTSAPPLVPTAGPVTAAQTTPVPAGLP